MHNVVQSVEVGDYIYKTSPEPELAQIKVLRPSLGTVIIEDAFDNLIEISLIDLLDWEKLERG